VVDLTRTGPEGPKKSASRRGPEGPLFFGATFRRYGGDCHRHASVLESDHGPGLKAPKRVHRDAALKGRSSSALPTDDAALTTDDAARSADDAALTTCGAVI